jgi:O-antigen/teichoic acid export membrane protein
MNISKKGRRRNLANREFSFFGNASILASGSAIASLISLAAEPIASRLFPPEVFGIVYAFYSLISIIGLIMCFRYEQAIVLPDNHPDAAGLLKLGSLLLFGWIFVFYLFIWTTKMVEWLEWESIRQVVWLLPLLSGFMGFWYVFISWFTRKKKFIHISISSVLVQIPQVFLIIIGGYLGYNTAIHLIDYRVVGILIPPLFLFIFFMIQDSWIFKLKHRAKDLLRLAKRYKKFPLYEFWSIMMSVIAFNGPVLLFPVLFDAGSAGHFSKAVYMLYVIPIMIGNSFSQVLFQQMAELKNKGQSTEPMVRMTIKSVIFIGTIPLILVSIAGPEIFSVLLGSRWEIAGQYSQFLSIWLFFLLLSTSLHSAYMVFEKQEIALVLNFLAVAIRLGILIICARLVKQEGFTIVLTVIIFSIGSALINLAKVMYIGHLIKLRLLSLFREIRLYLFFMIMVAGIYVLIKQMLSMSDLVVFFIGAILGVIYYTVLLLTQPAIKKLLLSSISKGKSEG